MTHGSERSGQSPRSVKKVVNAKEKKDGNDAVKSGDVWVEDDGDDDDDVERAGTAFDVSSPNQGSRCC